MEAAQVAGTVNEVSKPAPAPAPAPASAPAKIAPENVQINTDVMQETRGGLESAG